MRKVIQTNTEYHSDPAISASGLKTIFLKSVYHHLYKEQKTTPNMVFGSAVHSYFLEGIESFRKEFYVYEKPDLRTKAGKELKAAMMAEAGSRNLITADEMETILKIEKNYQANELALKYSKGEIEVSHYGEFQGIPLKVRPDCYDKKQGWISDIKTCQDNSPKAFRKDIYKWAYHLQAVVYCIALGIPVQNFRFIAIETVYPYSVQVYCLNEDMIEYGQNAFLKAINDWKFYLETGIELGYNTNASAADGALII